MELLRQTFYNIVKPFVILFCRLRFNLHIGENPLREANGSYLLIGHHVHDMDAIFVMMAGRGIIRFLAGDANMDTPWKKFLFTATGMIPFKKKRSDMKSIRRLMALTKAGIPIGLYPEGGRNWDGATDTLIPSTSKLIKMLGIDVYQAVYHGGYLSRPRWSDYGRKGLLNLEIKLLFSKDDIKSLSASEISNRMEAALEYNAFEWQKIHQIPFRGKALAESIERLLYLCPVCHHYNSFHSHDDHFVCEHCASDYTIDAYGFIRGPKAMEDTRQWNLWQKSSMGVDLPDLSRDTYQLSNIPMEIRKVKNPLHRTKKLVDLAFNNTDIVIKDGDTVNTIGIAETYGFSFTFLDVFEFYTNENKYRFTFNPRHHLSNVFVLDLLTHFKENLS